MALVIISDIPLLAELQLPGSTIFLNDVAVNGIVFSTGTKVNDMFKGLPEYNILNDTLTLPGGAGLFSGTQTHYTSMILPEGASVSNILTEQFSFNNPNAFVSTGAFIVTTALQDTVCLTDTALLNTPQGTQAINPLSYTFANSVYPDILNNNTYIVPKGFNFNNIPTNNIINMEFRIGTIYNNAMASSNNLNGVPSRLLTQNLCLFKNIPLSDTLVLTNNMIILNGPSNLVQGQSPSSLFDELDEYVNFDGFTVTISTGSLSYSIIIQTGVYISTLIVQQFGPTQSITYTELQGPLLINAPIDSILSINSDTSAVVNNVTETMLTLYTQDFGVIDGIQFPSIVSFPIGYNFSNPILLSHGTVPTSIYKQFSNASGLPTWQIVVIVVFILLVPTSCILYIYRKKFFYKKSKKNNRILN